MSERRLIVLTPQQRVVLGHLTWDGADNRLIARRMGLSEQTVKHHLKGLMAAFGTSNRAAIVADCHQKRVVVRTVVRPSRYLEETA